MKIKWKEPTLSVFGEQIPLRYLFPIIIVFIGLIFIKRSFNQDKWDTLTSRDYGYQIEYPANWAGEVIKSGRGSDYLHGRVNDNYLLPRSYLLIHFEPMTDPTFKDGAIWGEEIIKRTCGYICWEGMQTQNVGVNEYIAMTTTYREKVSFGQTLETEVYIIVVDNGMYMLQFHTYNQNQKIQDIFEHMLDSFEILE